MLLLPTLVGGQGIATIDRQLFVGTWNLHQKRWVSESTVCVEPGAGVVAYRITATSINNPTNFELHNEIGDSVNYRVYWQDRSHRQNLGDELRSGFFSKKTYRVSGQCLENGPSGYIRVKIPNKSLEAAPPGIYQDRLMLTVSPI